MSLNQDIQKASASYIQSTLQRLKDKGYRITKPRQRVVELLSKAEGALSAYEIKDLLDAEQEHVDIVSIYRILDCLEENQLIHRMLETGKVRKCQLDPEDSCHRHQHDHCHHFLICSKCGGIEEIHCTGIDPIVDEVARQAGFLVEDHRLEFRGICKSCR